MSCIRALGDGDKDVAKGVAMDMDIRRSRLPWKLRQSVMGVLSLINETSSPWLTGF